MAPLIIGLTLAVIHLMMVDQSFFIAITLFTCYAFGLFLHKKYN